MADKPRNYKHQWYKSLELWRLNKGNKSSRIYWKWGSVHENKRYLDGQLDWTYSLYNCDLLQSGKFENTNKSIERVFVEDILSIWDEHETE